MKKILFSAILLLFAASTSVFAQNAEEEDLDLKLAPGTPARFHAQ